MRVAIVGGGVSGLVAAYLLHPRHEITVFEAGSTVGGHVHTVPVETADGPVGIDTGFIVYNERNYPNFTRLLARLGVATQPSTMSFSVRLAKPDLEYNGSSLRQLFAQPRNVTRPWFYRMLVDIFRFNRGAALAVRNGSREATLGELVSSLRLGSAFRDHYLVPMGAAIWSAAPDDVLRMPAEFFVRFFENHGMLTVDDRPEWRTVVGGSARYAERLTGPFADRIRTAHAVREVRRHPDRVEVDGERFDHVVLACHSDQALRLLADPIPAEREVLGAIPYQANDVVLHNDVTLLPRRRSAWGAWNYHAVDPARPVAITYYMNDLQGLTTADHWCVTLNATEEIESSRIVRRFNYHHPVFTREGIEARLRWSEVSDPARRTHYCGAYWGNGFHEDGVSSALRVARSLVTG
ncbi:MAG: NAD(P)/FAD-dependent oxidoreductase [Gemmatimonadales bacterium]